MVVRIRVLVIHIRLVDRDRRFLHADGVAGNGLGLGRSDLYAFVVFQHVFDGIGDLLLHLRVVEGDHVIVIVQREGELFHALIREHSREGGRLFPDHIVLLEDRSGNGLCFRQFFAGFLVDVSDRVANGRLFPSRVHGDTLCQRLVEVVADHAALVRAPSLEHIAFSRRRLLDRIGRFSVVVLHGFELLLAAVRQDIDEGDRLFRQLPRSVKRHTGSHLLVSGIAVGMLRVGMPAEPGRAGYRGLRNAAVHVSGDIAVELDIIGIDQLAVVIVECQRVAVRGIIEVNVKILRRRAPSEGV